MNGVYQDYEIVTTREGMGSGLQDDKLRQNKRTLYLSPEVNGVE
jgi:hypothetical protein